MLHRLVTATALALAFSAYGPSLQAQAASATTPAPHRFVQVTLPAGAAPTSGRLLVFATEAKAARAAAKDGQVTSIDTSPFSP